MKYLIDINVLIQAIWINHSKHTETIAWMEGKDILVCPLSELGFIRISTGILKAPMGQTRQLLEQFLKERSVGRIADDIPALESSAKKSDDVTDYYLAALAEKHGCKFATSDKGIKHSVAIVVA